MFPHRIHKTKLEQDNSGNSSGSPGLAYADKQAATKQLNSGNSSGSPGLVYAHKQAATKQEQGIRIRSEKEHAVVLPQQLSYS